MLAVEAVLGRRDQPVGAGAKGDLHTLDVNAAAVVDQRVGHAVLGRVDRVVLETAVAAPHGLEAGPMSPVLHGNDKPVAGLELAGVFAVVVQELHAQQVRTLLRAGDVLEVEVHDRFGLALAFLGVHAHPPTPVGILLADPAIHLDRVVVAVMNHEQECARIGVYLGNGPLREGQRIAVDHEAAHRDILTLVELDDVVPGVVDKFGAVALDGEALYASERNMVVRVGLCQAVAPVLKDHLSPGRRRHRRRYGFADCRAIIGCAVTLRPVVGDAELLALAGTHCAVGEGNKFRCIIHLVTVLSESILPPE